MGLSLFNLQNAAKYIRVMDHGKGDVKVVSKVKIPAGTHLFSKKPLMTFPPDYFTLDSPDDASMEDYLSAIFENYKAMPPEKQAAYVRLLVGNRFPGVWHSAEAFTKQYVDEKKANKDNVDQQFRIEHEKMGLTVADTQLKWQVAERSPNYAYDKLRNRRLHFVGTNLELACTFPHCEVSCNTGLFSDSIVIAVRDILPGTVLTADQPIDQWKTCFKPYAKRESVNGLSQCTCHYCDLSQPDFETHERLCTELFAMSAVIEMRANQENYEEVEKRTEEFICKLKTYECFSGSPVALYQRGLMELKRRRGLEKEAAEAAREAYQWFQSWSR